MRLDGEHLKRSFQSAVISPATACSAHGRIFQEASVFNLHRITHWSPGVVEYQPVGSPSGPPVIISATRRTNWGLSSGWGVMVNQEWRVAVRPKVGFRKVIEHYEERSRDQNETNFLLSHSLLFDNNYSRYLILSYNNKIPFFLFLYQIFFCFYYDWLPFRFSSAICRSMTFP